MKHINDNHGNAYIEFLVAFFCIMLCIALAVSVLPIFTTKSKLDAATDKLMRSAEMTGSTSLQAKIDALKEETKLNFTVSWDGTDYMGGTKKVQLNSDIGLELTVVHDIGFYKFGSIPIKVTSRQVGTGERYQK
ncbi:MAG: DUF4320 family protein [Oscillospiraceae bacterium]